MKNNKIIAKRIASNAQLSSLATRNKKLEIKLPIKGFVIKNSTLVIKDAQNNTHYLRPKDGTLVCSRPPLQNNNICDTDFVKKLSLEIIHQMRDKIFDEVISMNSKVSIYAWEEFAGRVLICAGYKKNKAKILNQALKDWTEEGWIYENEYDEYKRNNF